MRSVFIGLAVAGLAVGASRALSGGPQTPSTDQPGTPLLRSERSTTDATLALRNLEDSIASLESRLKTGEAAKSRRAELADQLLMRAQFLGRVSDTEHAAGIAATLAEEEPRNARALLLRGRTRAALHLFGSALVDFDAAQRVGAEAAATSSARATVLAAIGRSREAIEIRTRLSREKPDILSLGAQAVAVGESGDLETARSLFRQAQNSYRDVSPFPLAWIYFQEGKLEFAHNNLDRARVLFAAAVDQAPFYLAAAGHLGEVEAALGHIDDAIARLRAVAAVAEDPDSEGQLCRVLRESGRANEARSCRTRVAARYAAALARHPEAFWDHAAEFFLAMDEPRIALEYAKKNLNLRQTGAAFDLAIRSAIAAGDRASACGDARKAVDRTPGRAPEPLIRDALALCSNALGHKG